MKGGKAYFLQQLQIIYIAFVVMANKRAKECGDSPGGCRYFGSIMKHWIKYQQVSMDEYAAPFRPAGDRAAVCPGNDSISRNGHQGTKLENSQA